MSKVRSEHTSVAEHFWNPAPHPFETPVPFAERPGAGTPLCLLLGATDGRRPAANVGGVRRFSPSATRAKKLFFHSRSYIARYIEKVYF